MTQLKAKKASSIQKAGSDVIVKVGYDKNMTDDERAEFSASVKESLTTALEGRFEPRLLIMKIRIQRQPLRQQQLRKQQPYRMWPQLQKSTALPSATRILLKQHQEEH